MINEAACGRFALGGRWGGQAPGNSRYLFSIGILSASGISVDIAPASVYTNCLIQWMYNLFSVR